MEEKKKAVSQAEEGRLVNLDLAPSYLLLIMPTGFQAERSQAKTPEEKAMSLPKAYCVEVKKVVDIFEAHEIYFSQAGKRERLNFLCPDEACRVSLRPEITAVNYDKAPNDDFKVRPHFRVNGAHPHIESCGWVEINDLIEEVEKGEESERLRHLKKSEIINTFTPANDGDKEQPSGFDIDAGLVRHITSLPTKQRKVDELKSHMRASFNKTSRLHEVVHCFQALEDHETRLQQLSIPPFGSKPYRTWFRASRFARETETPLIYYGLVNIQEYPSGYSLKFCKKSQQEDGTACNTFTFIKKDAISRFRGGRLLRATLDAAVSRQDANRFPTTAYIFGRCTRNMDHNRINITYDSLHSVVVMLNSNGE